MSDMPLRQCTGACGQEYPATKEFWHRDKNTKDGFNSRCKVCRNMHDKEYRDRPEVKKHKKNYRSQPEIRKRDREQKKEYQARPKVKKHRSKHMREYHMRTEVQERIRNYHSRTEVQELYRSLHRNRDAKSRSIKGIHTSQQIQEQLKRQKHRCYYAYCGHAKFQKKGGKYIYHVEHTFPISRVAGSDIPANSIDYLVLACPNCNISKNDRFPWEWPEGGRLC